MDDIELSPIVAAKSGNEIFGIELRTYSASRKVAAQSMGLMFPVVGQEGMDQMKRTGLYPGALKDTVIILWLCSLKDHSDLTPEETKAGIWTPSRALHSPATALEVAMAWADGFAFLDGDRFETAMVKMMETVRPAQDAEFSAKKDQGTPDESGNV